MSPATPAEVRLTLHRTGYSPLPLVGKQPVLKDWQKHTDVTAHEIEFWSRSSPAAENTGILTRLVPTFDIDILDLKAAEAVEALTRERFEEHGHVLPRVGNPPKRAIPFRTDTPFAKIKVELIAPDGSTGQKLEMLCDGQQVVVDGVHPDTHKPYIWTDGAPGQIPRQGLPYIHDYEAQALVDAAVEILVTRFGYRRAIQAKAKRAANGDEPADWTIDFSDHDALAALAMKLLKTGMHDGAAVNFLRDNVAALANIDPDRKARRLKEIPSMVASARQKLESGAAASTHTPATDPPPFAPADAGVRQPGKAAKFKLVSFENIKFVTTEEWLVKKLLPRQGVAPIFGSSMTFKSFIIADLGLHVALGWDWAGRRTKQGPVVYVAAENAGGVRKRKAGFELAHADRLPPRVPFYLVEAAPNLGTERNDRDALIASIEAVSVSPALIIIDTLAQTLGGGEENNTGMMTFLGNTTAFANHFKACVVPVHHVPLADQKRMRGHSSLQAGVDALLRAERRGKDLATTLSLEKLKDDEDGIELTVRLARIVIGHDEDGDEISTLVVSGVEGCAPAQAARPRAPRAVPPQRRLLMEVVEQAIGEAGQDLCSFAGGPMVRAVDDEAVRLRFYSRIGEQAAPGEDEDRLAEKQRQAFSRAVKAALEAKDIIARAEGKRRVLWLP